MLVGPHTRRYRPGSSGAAKALLAMRDGWSALKSFSALERGAMAIVGASLLPYSPMHRPAGKLLDCPAEARHWSGHQLADALDTLL